MDNPQRYNLTDQEKELLYYYRRMNGAQKEAIFQLANAYLIEEKQARGAKYEARDGVLYIKPRTENLQ